MAKTISISDELHEKIVLAKIRLKAKRLEEVIEVKSYE